jgi:hypothetical protein
MLAYLRIAAERRRPVKQRIFAPRGSCHNFSKSVVCVCVCVCSVCVCVCVCVCSVCVCVCQSQYPNILTLYKCQKRPTNPGTDSQKLVPQYTYYILVKLTIQSIVYLQCNK